MVEKWQKNGKIPLFDAETVRIHILSKELQFQKFQERSAQRGAFERSTWNI